MSAPAPDPARVRLVAFDSDGTLTDRGIGWDTDGRGTRRFDVRDGIAMQWAGRVGLPVVVISGKDSAAVGHRLSELEVPGFQGVKDKVACLRAFAAPLGIGLEACAFLGDDLPDVPALRAVGYPMAVADAHPLVRGLAAWTSRSAGGFGAAREALEHVLMARGLWRQVLERYGAADLLGGWGDAPGDADGEGRVTARARFE
jgi:3-deoxy-D-manno-octulosonate 8-phosphate phosphatase (KDO 8-P phosphatase)